MADDDPELSLVERNKLITDIRLAYHAQRALLNAFFAGVELGAEEVQDERIRALEEPPETPAEFEEILIPMILTLVLESTAAGVVIGALKKPLVTLLQTRVAAKRQTLRQTAKLAKQELGNLRRAARQAEKEARFARAVVKAPGGGSPASTASDAADRAGKALAELERAKARISSRVTPAENAFTATKAVLETMMSPDFETYVVAGLKSIREQTPQFPARRVISQFLSPVPAGGAGPVTPPTAATAMGPLSGIPPHTTLRAAMAKSAARMIADTWVDQELLEERARADTVTVSEAAQIYEAAVVPPQIDLGQVIDRCQLAGAAAIWGTLIPQELNRSPTERAMSQDAAMHLGVRSGTSGMPSTQPFTLPEELQKHEEYLLRRFGPAARQWESDSRSTLGALGPVMPGPLPADYFGVVKPPLNLPRESEFSDDASLDLVIQFLWAARGQLLNLSPQ